MKTIKLTLIALLFSIILPSYAHAISFFDSYAQFYTVDNSGSTTAQTTFTGNNVPNLYLQLYSTPTSFVFPTNIDVSLWQNSAPSNIYTINTTTTQNQNWLSFSQNYWNNIDFPGAWTVQAQGTQGSSNFLGITTFNVLGNGAGNGGNFHLTSAPEAKGTILFLLGASIMTIFLLRRKKIAA